VRNPKQGAIVRVSPDGAQSEVIAHGFRNGYDLTFDPRGSLWLVDSDGERDQYLPWYSPTRLFDVAQGMHHGWMLAGWARSWNRPAWFFDNTERIVEIGRGSPTGIDVYCHDQFPTSYIGGLLSCCWSLGRIYHFPLTPDGATYSSRAEVFLESTGNEGFAPVDLAVGPQGDLFVAIGGRGTRGGVFRISYPSVPPSSSKTASDAADTNRSSLEAVLSANQPLSSWSRAAWIPTAKNLGRAAFEEAARDGARSPAERIRAIEVLVELFSGVPIQLAKSITETADSLVTARVAWALSRRPPQHGGELFLSELTHSEEPWIERAAWESLGALPELNQAGLTADWDDLSEERPRRVRAAAVLAAARLNQETFAHLETSRSSFSWRLAVLWAKHFRHQLNGSEITVAREILAHCKETSLKLEAVRILQILWGDVQVEPTPPYVYAGYALQPTEWRISDSDTLQVMRTVESLFPSGNESLDFELSRLAGMLDSVSLPLIYALSAKWSATSRVEGDIHYLIVLSRLPGPRSQEVTNRTASALTELHPKMTRGEMYASRFWPERISETFTALSERDPALVEAVLIHPQFRAPAQSLFGLTMSKPQQLRAAERLLETVDDDWSADLVRLVGTLPVTTHQPRLREVWDHAFSLRDAVTAVLANSPQEDDRARFIEMLRVGAQETIPVAAKALASLSRTRQPQEIAVALDAMRQHVREKQAGDTITSLDRLLAIWLDGAPTPAIELQRKPTAVYERWLNRFQYLFPDEAAQLAVSPEQDAAALLSRLPLLDWSVGDKQRGEIAFQRLTCARCHAGPARLGPDLSGVGQRFSRQDLFQAIVDPNRDVSQAYRMSQVVTAEGRVVVGQIIYESPEATLVQTSADTTVRIADDEILSIDKSPLSPMPTGLLRNATDEELVDLYAYLQQLSAKSK
jgi:putative heme-binding domain-containing protein